MQHDGVEQEHTTRPGQHELNVMPMNGYSECDNDSGSADGMDSDE